MKNYISDGLVMEKDSILTLKKTKLTPEEEKEAKLFWSDYTEKIYIKDPEGAVYCYTDVMAENKDLKKMIRNIADCLMLDANDFSVAFAAAMSINEKVPAESRHIARGQALSWDASYKREELHRGY